MADKRRLIDANALMDAFRNHMVESYDRNKCTLEQNCKTCEKGCLWRRIVTASPTVDAVPVDEIRVDIMRLSLENQEAVLNVFICGKPNEVKIPFSKDVAEVVRMYTLPAKQPKNVLLDRKCGICDQLMLSSDSYCPMCGAENHGERRTDENN